MGEWRRKLQRRSQGLQCTWEMLCMFTQLGKLIATTLVLFRILLQHHQRHHHHSGTPVKFTFKVSNLVVLLQTKCAQPVLSPWEIKTRLGQKIYKEKPPALLPFNVRS